MSIQIGDKVETLSGDIDYRKHAGAVGVVTGFSRFSPYHGREVRVKAEDGSWWGWFWLSTVKAAPEDTSNDDYDHQDDDASDAYEDEESRPEYGSQEWAETHGDDLGESPDF